MGDDDRPFACPHLGCGMRFTNEDHLSVHKMKHEMSLSLSSGIGGKTPSNLLFVDQTPTPTKFLKNCEEIGLFSELNKNPFEEAFKKAVHENLIHGGIGGHVPTSSLALISMGGEHDPPDTLNTPTPHIPVHDSPPRPRKIATISPPVQPEYIPLPGPPSPTHEETTYGTPLTGPHSPSHEESRYEALLPGPSSDAGSTVGTPSIAHTPVMAHTPSMGGDPGMGHLPTSPLMDMEEAIDLRIGEHAIKHEVTDLTIYEPEERGQRDQQPSSTTTEESVYSRGGASPIRHILSSTTTSPSITSSQPSPVSVVGEIKTPTVAASPAYMVQVLLQLPDGRTMPVHIPAQVAAPHAPLPTPRPANLMTVPTAGFVPPPLKRMALPASTEPAPSSSSLAKQKLKAALTQNTQPTLAVANSPEQHILQGNMKVMAEAVDRVTSQIEASSPVQHTLLRSPPTTRTLHSLSGHSFTEHSGGPLVVQTQAADTSTPFKRKRGSEDDQDDRRRKFLERNRAAAARCRSKRKNWITCLEGKGEELQTLNSKLAGEVTLLRNEVAQLKTLLLAHKDCPITMQQRNSGQLSIHSVSTVELNKVSQATVVGETVTLTQNPTQTVTLSQHPTSGVTLTQNPTSVVTLSQHPTSQPHSTVPPSTTMVTSPIVIAVSAEPD